MAITSNGRGQAALLPASMYNFFVVPASAAAILQHRNPVGTHPSASQRRFLPKQRLVILSETKNLVMTTILLATLIHLYVSIFVSLHLNNNICYE